MRWVLLSPVVIIAAVAALAAIPERNTDAAWPGDNGRILYTDPNNSGIWSMNPDGTGRRNLDSSDGVWHPSWSPDGAKIVYRRGLDIWTMDADGANQQLIAYGASPSWSNDGTRILFERGGLIMEMDADGSNEETLTQDALVFDSFPVHQPGGDLIAFLRAPTPVPSGANSSANITSDVWLMHPDGSTERVTDTPGYWEGWPDWSPDGTQLVFRGPGKMIVKWTLGSADPPQPLHGGDDIFIDSPSWSPDGAKITFSQGTVTGSTRERAPSGSPAANAEIWIMNADGSDPHVVPGSGNDPLEFSPDWGVAEGAPRIWGDVDCDGEVTTRDNQAELRFVLTQAPLSQTEPCPDIGAEIDAVDVDSELHWGDEDCDGDVTTRDNQAKLRNVLQQSPLSQTEPCPDVGSEVRLR